MNFIASSFSKLFENSSEGLIGKYDRVFVSQQHKWDCGLACCAMLLNWLELDSRGVYMSKESQRGSPLWSIELFCLLRSLDVPCDLYATSVSVEHHSQTDWYKPHIDSDRVAVEACRETARLKGWDSSIHLVCLSCLFLNVLHVFSQEKFAMCELKELLSTGFVCTVMLVHSPILLIDSVEDVDRYWLLFKCCCPV